MEGLNRAALAGFLRRALRRCSLRMSASRWPPAAGPPNLRRQDVAVTCPG